MHQFSNDVIAFPIPSRMKRSKVDLILLEQSMFMTLIPKTNLCI